MIKVFRRILRKAAFQGPSTIPHPAQEEPLQRKFRRIPARFLNCRTARHPHQPKSHPFFNPENNRSLTSPHPNPDRLHPRRKRSLPRHPPPNRLPHKQAPCSRALLLTVSDPPPSPCCSVIHCSRPPLLRSASFRRPPPSFLGRRVSARRLSWHLWRPPPRRQGAASLTCPQQPARPALPQSAPLWKRPAEIAAAGGFPEMGAVPWRWSTKSIA
mmetsp:Transcript_6948/g.17046  ORF Transcript_6948/g.17046 Transcript_6948/m.17046 type:complete len:214 (+) Transcript_6948:362-1003(+)